LKENGAKENVPDGYGTFLPRQIIFRLSGEAGV
jgi:hypothetical protein